MCLLNYNYVDRVYVTVHILESLKLVISNMTGVCGQWFQFRLLSIYQLHILKIQSKMVVTNKVSRSSCPSFAQHSQ